MSDSAVSTSSSLELDKLSQQINGSDKLVAWKLVATEAKVIADALRDKTTTGASHCSILKSIAEFVMQPYKILSENHSCQTPSLL